MKLGVLWRLSKLVKPLAKYMCIAVTLGTLAALCALLGAGERCVCIGLCDAG